MHTSSQTLLPCCGINKYWRWWNKPHRRTKSTSTTNNKLTTLVIKGRCQNLKSTWSSTTTWDTWDRTMLVNKTTTAKSNFRYFSKWLQFKWNSHAERKFIHINIIFISKKSYTLKHRNQNWLLGCHEAMTPTMITKFKRKCKNFREIQNLI